MSIKYAVVTGVLLVGIVIFSMQHLGGRNIRQIEDQIDRNGVSRALFLSADIVPDDVSTARGTRGRSNLQQKLERFLAAFEVSGVLDVLVTRGTSTLIASARPTRSIETANKELLSSPTVEGRQVQIHALEIDGVPSRSYETEIPDGDDTVVAIFVSAESIEAERREIQGQILTVSFIALCVGLPVVVLIGGLLTRPVRALRRDMATVARGDFSHRSDVRSGDELESLAAAFNRMTSQLAESQAQEAQRRALERELTIATRIQNALLPDRLPELDGYQVHAHYRSAKEVGGDYYDFIELPNGRIVFVVADVSGKGVPGSLVMTMTRSLVRMSCREDMPIVERLRRVNQSLARDMTRGMFVTLIMAELDPSTGEVSIARAGHNPALWYRADSGEVVSRQPGGIALGMVDEPFAGRLQIDQIQLDPGDELVLYTDGIIEAMDNEGQEYTMDRFMAALRALHDRNPAEIVDAVVADVARHVRGAEPSDDITLIVLKREST